jgi:hypothetical protein
MMMMMMMMITFLTKSLTPLCISDDSSFQGILAEILEPIMGKGLIPADPVTWGIRRRQIVPAFHKVRKDPSFYHGFGSRDTFFLTS